MQSWGEKEEESVFGVIAFVFPSHLDGAQLSWGKVFLAEHLPAHSEVIPCFSFLVCVVSLFLLNCIYLIL